MLRCDTCNTWPYCREHQECRRLGSVVAPLAPRPPAPIPIDVPDPAQAPVSVEAKPPAPTHEPKGPMSTLSGSKPARKSLTIQGATLAILATLVPLLLSLVGIEVTGEEVTSIISTVLAVIGSIIAIYGRMNATKVIQ